MCKRFLRTGVCHQYPKCKQRHRVPAATTSILLEHLFQTPYDPKHLKGQEEEEGEEEDTWSSAIHTEAVDHHRRYQAFLSFYDDIRQEFSKFGTIVSMKVSAQPSVWK